MALIKPTVSEMTYREAKGMLASMKVRSQEVKQFYIHLATYLAANTFLVTMNILDGPDAPVALLPVLLWGVFVLRHSLKVFGWRGKKSKEWEKEFLKELMDGEPIPGEETPLLAAHNEQDVLKMKKRIENLEAIISSGQWDENEPEAELVLSQSQNNKSSSK